MEEWKSNSEARTSINTQKFEGRAFKIVEIREWKQKVGRLRKNWAQRIAEVGKGRGKIEQEIRELSGEKQQRRNRIATRTLMP